MIYSTKSRDVNGWSNKDYQEFVKKESYRTGKMKKRLLKQLSAAECFKIVSASVKDLRSHKDIAAEYHTCPQLVGRLVKSFKGNNSLIMKKRD